MNGKRFDSVGYAQDRAMSRACRKKLHFVLQPAMRIFE
jgi:hypothetical protein